MAKPKEAVAQPKPHRTGVVRFFSETVHELRRVRWPKRREVVNYTVAALLVCFIMGLLVWGFDLGVARLFALVNLV
ncbi:preprotein translocase subunit SecE [Alicyclobacillus sp.]|uniref:preprotein translocase subunit SecE n=1 Tax=Alicyclobacillus sp. TaxID=61169 RepID=UPI0025B9D81B|nr:preprotein translocase subunit SecE [Alicyclobacillus sp.]MCL6517311.1 preprotein translocase subunit SecE [Alicyclobacillus sp.]